MRFAHPLIDPGTNFRPAVLGVKTKKAWKSVYEGRKSLWALSHSSAVDKALSNSHWDARGLVSLRKAWRVKQVQIIAPTQLTLNWDTARS